MCQGDGKKAENRSPGNKGGRAKKSVIKAADQAWVIRPLALTVGFSRGEGEQEIKARMIDCALIMEGPETGRVVWIPS